MKVKVIKKIMAYLLVGAMVISTPITASATEASIADVYTSTDDADKSSGTATLSSTETGTYKFEDVLRDPDREAQVIGLALDKTSLSLEVNGAIQTDRLQARVLYSGYDATDEEMVLAADQQTKEIIDKYLRWEVLGNENQIVGISYYQNTDGTNDSSMVNVRAKKGGNVTVRAIIDYNANGQLDDGEFYADAAVSVKELASNIEFVNLPEKFYLKQKYNLNNYIKVTPETATTCNVSFYVATADAKKVTISDNGEMTVKKAPATETITLYATTENGINKSTKITLDPGVQANKVAIASDNGATLDLGKVKDKDMTIATLTATLTSKAGTTDDVTDSVTWTVKNPKTAVLAYSVGESDRKLNIKALSVGTATVTATASSGKKATFKVTVDSTPFGVEVTDIETWTGKKPTLAAVLYADDGKTVIAPGKTKVSFSAPKKQDDDKVSANIKNIKVSAKGVITSLNYLTDTSKNGLEKDRRTVIVTAKHGKDDAITDTCTVTVKQADIQDITVANITHGEPGTPIAFNTKGAATETGQVVGGKYQYKACALDGNKKPLPDLDDAIVWASSSAKVGTISESGLFTALKGGTAKLTASYVTLTTKNNKTTGKLNKKTITVKPVQKATSLTLNKNVFVAVAGTTTNVAINVKKQLPSGSKDLITWKKVVGNEKGAVIETSENLAPTNAKTTAVKVTVPSTYAAGTVIKIGAYADGGAVAYAYIYVVDAKTSSVQVWNNNDEKVTNNGKSGMKVGDVFEINPQIVVGSGRTVQYTSATSYTKDNIGYVSDPVTYSFSKAGIASLNKDGNVIALKPGTTKLTVQSLSGKKATVTIKVVE